MAGSRAVQHAARALEKQALEEAVIEHVQERARVAQGRHRGIAISASEQANPDPEGDDADVLDAVIGEQPLEVVLG